MPARKLRTTPTKVERDSASASIVTPSKKAVAGTRRSSRAAGLPASPPPTSTPAKSSKSAASSSSGSPSKQQSNAERKLASFRANFSASPFPDLSKPSPEDAAEVAELLRAFHGYKKLPQKSPPREDRFGGCGDVASVLDALIRTVLSCNTSNKNSAAAHRSLCERFGKANWEKIHAASQAELADSIRCGGLHERKAKIIKGILNQVKETHGKLSLDHLHSPSLTTDDIMAELLAFDGVGPKVASCVVAFCIGREECAVDTHVYRLSKKLGWVPEKATRDQTYYHLAARLPPHLKFPIHTLLIKHGKRCDDCSARGFATEKERGAAVKAEVKPEGVEEVKKEAGLKVKKEEAQASDDEESSDDDDNGGSEEMVKLEEGHKKKCPLREAGLFNKGARRSTTKVKKDEAGEADEKKVKLESESPRKRGRAGEKEDAGNGGARASPRKRVKSET